MLVFIPLLKNSLLLKRYDVSIILFTFQFDIFPYINKVLFLSFFNISIATSNLFFMKIYFHKKLQNNNIVMNSICYFMTYMYNC